MIEKYVLTGAPGSGKSSILLALEPSFFVIREPGEDYIRLRQAEGIEKPWEEENFIDKILTLQILRETYAEGINHGRKILLDRGIPDGLAYYQIAGRKPSPYMKKEIKKVWIKKPYTKIFLIENFGECKETRVRREDLEMAIKLEKLQEINYKKLGFEVIRIGYGTLQERAERVYKNIYPE